MAITRSFTGSPGRYPAAGDAFRQAMHFNRGGAPNEDPGIDYGVYLFRQARAEEALEPLEAAVKRHPDSGRAHLELGCVQLALDRLAERPATWERELHAAELEVGAPGIGVALNGHFRGSGRLLRRAPVGRDKGHNRCRGLHWGRRRS